MNFSTAEKVQDTIRASNDVERVRSANRAKINDMFNAVPSVDDDTAAKMGMEININWGEAAVLGQHGRRQYNTAFLKPGNFFKVTLPLAPNEQRKDWESTITTAINRIMKRSRKYYHQHRYKWSSVLVHGIGPQIWYDNYSWCPDFKAINDLRVATDTTTDFENLSWFGARHPYTVGEISKKVFGNHADPNWNRKIIGEMLDQLKDVNYENTDYNWADSPEKMAEMVKQNGGYYSSDATPKLWFWHFYYYDDSDPSKCAWKLKVVPDLDSSRLTAAPVDEFLYESDEPLSKELSQILHCQFGDLNVDPPFKYHSVRSLGFELYEPCFWTNLTRCRLLQHTWESFNVWLRNTDPAGKERAQMLNLFHKAFLPEGVSIVPQTERHQIDPRLVSAVMQELRQLMSEAAVSYTQDVHEQGSEEETATKTMAKVQQVNAMLGGLLDDAFQQETWAYREIGRRFCLSKSDDPDVQLFQKQCKEAGIPRQWLNVEYWDIEPEIPLGSGNPTMGMLESQQLMEIRPAMDPTAQQEVLHERIVQITGDPRKAKRWAPIDGKRGITDAQQYAASIFGTLMQGVPVPPKEGMNVIDQIDVLLGLMGGVVSRIQQTGAMATMGEVAGLNATAGYLGQLMQQLGQNPQEKQRVKMYGDQLGKLMNMVKAFAQRLQQQQGQANGDPSAALKAQAVIAQTQAKIKANEMSGAQKRRQKEISFMGEQKRKDLQTLGEEKRKNLQAEGELKRSEAEALGITTDGH